MILRCLRFLLLILLSFTDAFDQTLGLEAVNLDDRADDELTQFISFLQESMQTGFKHQANQENEELCRAPKLLVITISVQSPEWR